MDTIIKIENLSKQYRLGVVGSGTLKGDVQRLLAKIRGKEDPLLKIGEENILDAAGTEFVWALQDINLEVNRGEVLGIIGKNGAGKSTLLKILSRVTGPTTGSIKTRGRIASLLEVGTGFHPELTGKENIFLNGAILGMSRQEIKSKLDEIVAFAGVEKYITTPVKRYSSGMYVRLAFAVAAHLEPDILVVDEVLAVGDAEFQKKAIGKMKDVSQGEGRTVLFVSHNMATIESLCTRVLLLKNGQTEMLGNTAEIISNYIREDSLNITNEWVNNNIDPNCEMVLLTAKLIDDKDSLRSSFSNNEVIIVEISVDNRIQNEFLKIGFELMEEGWKKIFTSFHNDLGGEGTIGMGTNILRFSIPKNLLNKGNYTINILSGIHRVKWLFEYQSLLAFSIKFNVLNTDMPVDNRPGASIAPLLNCEIRN